MINNFPSILIILNGRQFIFRASAKIESQFYTTIKGKIVAIIVYTHYNIVSAYNKKHFNSMKFF